MRVNRWMVPAVITLTLVLLIWAMATNYSSIVSADEQAGYVAWNTGWQAETADAALRGLTLPARLQVHETTLSNTLPASIHPNALLYIKTNNQRVQATIAGVPAIVDGVTGSVATLSKIDLPWTVVRLTPDMAGKTIRITFSGTGNKPFVEVYAMRLGTVSRIQLTLLKSALPLITQCLLIALFALALFAFASLEANHYHKHIPLEYQYLLLFVTISGAWFFTDTDIVGVDYVGSQTFLVIHMLSVMLMPIPFLLFIYKVNTAFKRMVFIAFGSLALAYGVSFVLWLSGYFVLWGAMLVLHALGLIAAGFLLFTVFRYRKSYTVVDPLSIGVIITSVTAIIAITLFYLFPFEDNVLVFRYGMLGFMLTLTVSVLRSNVDIVMQANRFEALRIREEEYRIAVQQSEKHVVRYDVSQQAILQTEEAATLFGGQTVVPNMPEYVIARGIIAQDSIAEFRAFFEDIVKGVPNGSITVCTRKLDGGHSWYHADYTLIYTDDHRPLQAVISFFDITQQREKELAFQKWKQSYMEMPSAGMNYYEFNLTRDSFANEAGNMLPPLPAEAKRTFSLMIGFLADQHVLPQDDQPFREFFQRDRLLEAFAHGIRSDRLEFRRMDALGAPLWTVATIQLITDPYSNDVQSFLLLKDEDEQKRDELQVRARSNTDPLTGLLNRSAFEEQLTKLMNETDPNSVHALVMIDVDGFKRVNDTYGHHFGDHVLTDIAGSLRAMMRADDLIGRIGGDEYMVCLKNVREDSGFLERRSTFICQALNRQFGSDVAISGSVGLALYPRDGRTFDVLYQKADKALYYAKHHGKNRFVFYNDDLQSGDITIPSSSSLFHSRTQIDHVADAPNTAMRTLLIVDDIEMNRDVLGEIFNNEYNLLFAQDGQQCLDLLMRSETSISAVLLDLIMPGMSGLQVLERIQNDAYMASIPVIVTSAADETKYSQKAIELGATDFVGKPVDPQLVKLRVKNAVHKRETEELRAQNRYLLVQKSDESRHQDELRYIAEHDPLTNISNKATFYRKTKIMLDKYPETQFVMIAFDIEKFRVINDIFGHDEGDRLLHYIAQRMQTLYAGRATFSRIDADNFTICMPFEPGALKSRIAENEAELKRYDLPFEIVLVYGLYIIDDRTLPVSIMHDRAEMAKRTVKGNYVQRYSYYDDKLRQSLLDELDIVNNMNSALQNNQFEVYLQPKCLLRTGEIVGAEALVRWNHPTRGVLTPIAFVPIFEKNGFIMKLDAYVWEKVCQLLRKWMDQNNGQPLIPLSMNVSRVNIYNPALVSTLCGLADRYGVPRRMMELEITESAYTEDPKQLSGLISELRNQGFVVEMDDFGSAYSSLNMLKEISVDLLKLDMRFLFGDDQDGRGGTILSSIVRMARYLALPIVAEGVETAEQARFLHSIGCAVGQGYYYYRPMSVEQFERLLSSHPLTTLSTALDAYPEPSMRRVWSIDGDFSLMLASIPCAASLCEMSGDNIEILRVNDAYVTMTQSSVEKIYEHGANVRNLTTQENYQSLLTLFGQALTTRQIVESDYARAAKGAPTQYFHIKINYLSGDAVRALFFVAYNPICKEGDPA